MSNVIRSNNFTSYGGTLHYMKTLYAAPRIGIYAVIAATVFLSDCDGYDQSLKRPNMISLSARLEAIFDKTTPVCFSHFIVDVPATAVVVYGPAEAEVPIQYYPGQADSISQRVAEQLIEIEKYRKFLSKQNILDYPLFGKTIEGSRPGSKIAFGSKSQVGYDVYSFFPSGDDLFVQSLNGALPHQDYLTDLNKVSSHLRPRASDEVPNEPGSCIDGAFIAIPLEYEKVSVDVRLAEFPDVHFSIEVHKNQDRIPELSDLETRLKSAELEGGAWFSRVKFLRKSERQLGEWKGSEALALKPPQEVEKEAHEFHFISLGEPSSPLQPRVNIQLDTGADGKNMGALRPSLSDEEAVALWDKLISSIRVRPISDKRPGKIPLASSAATGAICPESGWWQCDEGGVIQSDRRRHVVAGEPMPYTTVPGHQTLWQKLRGEHPKYRAATVWKLAEYDSAPIPPENEHV